MIHRESHQPNPSNLHGTFIFLTYLCNYSTRTLIRFWIDYSMSAFVINHFKEFIKFNTTEIQPARDLHSLRKGRELAKQLTPLGTVLFGDSSEVLKEGSNKMTEPPGEYNPSEQEANEERKSFQRVINSFRAYKFVSEKLSLWTSIYNLHLQWDDWVNYQRNSLYISIHFIRVDLNLIYRLWTYS